MDESDCSFVSSRGLLKSCDIRSYNPVSSIKILQGYKGVSNTKKCPVIYITTSAIPDFKKRLSEFPSKFILVSGDCDQNNKEDIFSDEEEFNRFIESDQIVHWFTQNCVTPSYPKITPIPIGMDYHTLFHHTFHPWGKQQTPIEQEEDIFRLKKESKPFYDREIKIYSNCHFSVNTRYGYDRIDAVKNIPKELVYYEEKMKQRIDNWKEQVKYAFVLSPHGNGLDCHRTWEALILGCIPIVKTSIIDPLFNDLPVLIVKEWSDVNKELLCLTIIEFKEKKFNYQKLYLSYWINLIRSKMITLSFTFYPNLDSLNNDIKCVGKKSTEELMKICLSIKGCVGFNTLGYMKSKINTPLVSSQYFSKNDGLFVSEANQFSLEQSNFYIKELLNNNIPFMINRLGINENKFLFNKLNNIENSVIESQMESNAGIYGLNNDNIQLYIKLVLDSLFNGNSLVTFFDYPFVKQEESYFLRLNPHLKNLHYKVLEPFYLLPDHPVIELWTYNIHPKRILVINHAVESIQSQLYRERPKGVSPFKSFVFHPDQKFIFYKPYQCIGVDTLPHSNWIETFEAMKNEISLLKHDFDIALVSCGGYGSLINDFIYTELNKSCIYIGGGLQLLFGVWGDRWNTNENIKKIFDDLNLTPHLIRPSDKERPPNYKKIEGGCYW